MLPGISMSLLLSLLPGIPAMALSQKVTCEIMLSIF